jgi:hypothetical protein
MNVWVRTGPLSLVASLCFAGAGCGIFSPSSLPPLDGRTEALEDLESAVCPEGEIPCGEFCIDPETDRLNCGGCGSVCDVTEQCVAGDCTCPEPYIDCGGTCVNSQIDRRHCGECNHACDALAVCTSGSCVCPEGYDDCGGDCVDLNTDNANCGSCGNACTGGAFCNGSGDCATECGPPYTLCNPGAEPYCADLQVDPLNCSACGSACPTREHAISTCAEGTCGISCDVGFGNADGNVENGCECTITNPTELCDAIDNDCDGTVDEGFECVMGRSADCTLTASCTGGQLCGASCTWGPCENNTWDCTTPGSTESQDCGDGSCGMQTRGCGDDCGWGDWGSCELKTANECFADDVESQDCGGGSCGVQSRTCGSDCSWESWGTCSLKTGSLCYTGDTDTCTPSGTTCTGTRSCTTGCTWGTCTETCGGSTPNCCSNGCRQCCVNSDCNDGNPCTSNTCSGSGTCSNPVLPDMTSCTGGVCCGGVCRSGGECCSSADCDECVGTARNCTSYMDPAGCMNHEGCTWLDSFCTGTADACGTHDIISECYDCGCSWSGTCSGGPRPCDDHVDQMECLTCGCEWMDYYCSGTAIPCGSFTSQASCNDQDDCSWSACQSYHCS